jgi:drug/metabolite transporter (DMT)-like permease
MPKNKNKKDTWWFWFAIGLVSYLLIAPNTTIIRVLVQQIQPLEFTFLRSAMIVIIALPIILFSIRKFNKRNLMFTLGAGLCMTVATASLTYAVKYSSASYAAIIGLLSPILLVVLSSRFMGDKISPRAVAGVALAAAGALVVVALPLIISGKTAPHFYPLATTLMLLNCFFFTLGILFSRKSNEAGMPLAVNAGLMSLVIVIFSFAGMYAVEGLPTDLFHFSPTTWLGIFYSGVIVVFLARIMNIASYERVGAAVNGGLNYLGTIVAIVIPVVLLGETLSSTIVLGGVLILLGVWLTEKHRAKHHHHKYSLPH